MSLLPGTSKDELDKSDIEVPELPRWVLYLVVFFRVFGGLLIVAPIFYIVTVYTGIPLIPEVGSSSLLVWMGAVVAIEFAVVGIFFWPLAGFSWLMACLFYKPLRDSLLNELRKEK